MLVEHPYPFHTHYSCVDKSDHFACHYSHTLFQHLYVDINRFKIIIVSNNNIKELQFDHFFQLHKVIQAEKENEF